MFQVQNSLEKMWLSCWSSQKLKEESLMGFHTKYLQKCCKNRHSDAAVITWPRGYMNAADWFQLYLHSLWVELGSCGGGGSEPSSQVESKGTVRFAVIQSVREMPERVSSLGRGVSAAPPSAQSGGQQSGFGEELAEFYIRVHEGGAVCLIKLLLRFLHRCKNCSVLKLLQHQEGQYYSDISGFGNVELLRPPCIFHVDNGW